MSSLEISLALLAGAAILAVGAYNLWIARSRRTAASAKASADPVDRSEPSLSLDETERSQHEASDPGGLGQFGQRAPVALDELVDCIVELELASAQPGERLLLLTRSLRRAGSKPICVEGLPAIRPRPDSDSEPEPHPASAEADADAAASWQALAGVEHYRAVRVGVLLANRSGALNAMEFSEFVAAVQSLADQLSVLADTPDMGAVLARARELDEVCANLDAQIGVAIDCPEPLGVSDLARLATVCQCVERGNNRHARLGPSGEVVFSLALADSPNRLQLLLDVPRAPGALDPWQQMIDCARICVQQLGGTLVDDAGRALPEAQLTRIGEQLQMRYASLEDAGFPAGSALALRLFN
ncbi:MAG: cell division protein ZipA C-terminal FtsZ-binding domain-containing protein [Quisquiliibacterium sp.]